jgi:hypothetical protein
LIHKKGSFLQGLTLFLRTIIKYKTFLNIRICHQSSRIEAQAPNNQNIFKNLAKANNCKISPNSFF